MATTLSARDIRFTWPQLKLPMFFIVDDPAPCLNLAYYEQYFETHVRDVPNSFTDAWADLIAEFGVRGKFSVLPVPAGIGRIDRPLPDVKDADRLEFLRIIRERVSPQMDINIEFLTHFLAWDIVRERPIDYTEKTMGPFTNRDHLTRYFAYGLKILHDLGLNPTGATSPGYSCIDIELTYQAAIRDAVREVTGLPIAWYFLHVDTRSPVVLPRIMSLDKERGEACVTMVSAADDPSWNTQFGQPSRLDMLLTPDGQSGRLVELFRNQSVIGFHTHWQSLFSEGRWTGLHDLRITLSRIQEHFGERVQWTKCSELARIVAAQAMTESAVHTFETGKAEIKLNAATACPDFTVCIRLPQEVKALSINGVNLQEMPGSSEVLEASSWKQNGGEIAWCADLTPGETTITLQW